MVFPMQYMARETTNAIGDYEPKGTEILVQLIGVKIEKANTSPAKLLNNGATWALSFNFDAIKKALNDA